MIRWLSGEFFLDKRPNGGRVVLYRAGWVAFWGLLFTAGIRELLDPLSAWGFSLHSLRYALHDALPVGGAFFAGAYAALYARFASQWTYLAGVYNQIKASKLRPIENSECRLEANRWQAGFIADADELHLATKPMFMGIVAAWLAEPSIREAYLDANDAAELAQLESKLRAAAPSAAIVETKSP